MKKSEAIKFMEGRIKEILLTGGEIVLHMEDLDKSRAYFLQEEIANMNRVIFILNFIAAMTDAVIELNEQGNSVYSLEIYDEKSKMSHIILSCDEESMRTFDQDCTE